MGHFRQRMGGDWQRAASSGCLGHPRREAQRTQRELGAAGRCWRHWRQRGWLARATTRCCSSTAGYDPIGDPAASFCMSFLYEILIRKLHSVCNMLFVCCCSGREEVHRLLRGMKRAGCAPDGLLWSVCLSCLW